MTSTAIPSTASSQQTTKTPQNATSGLTHIGSMSRSSRAHLAQGPLVRFIDHQSQIIFEGENLVQMPLALFKAISSKPELVTLRQITIPEHINVAAVKFLIGRMNLLPSLPQVTDLASTNDTFRDVHLCSAADALGMGTVTQRIFDTYFKRVSTVVPNAANIDAITSIRTPQGDKLFGQMAFTIAKKLWNKELENGEDFKQHYLPTNPRMTAAIAEWEPKLKLKAARQADFEKRKAARLARERKVAEAERINKEQAAIKKENYLAAKKEKNVAAMKKKTEEEAKEKAAGISYREKKRNGVKVFTFAEARYAYKHEGVRVPVKSG